MKINIDYTKFNNAPCEISEEEDLEFVAELSQRLQKGCNSCFLVSGYRGSGKTSLIYKIKQKLNEDSEKTKEDKEETKEDNKELKDSEELKEVSEKVKKKEVLVVDINLVKYEETPIIMRKLIRGLFFKMQINKSFNGMKALKNKKLFTCSKKAQSDNKFFQYFNLLYLRTFNDVTLSSNYIKKFEFSAISNFTLENFKIIIFWIISVLLSLYVNIFSINIKALSAMFAIIMSFLLLINLCISLNKTKRKEINIKSLYDSDVAEYQITEILKGLQDRNYKVIFVLDEMDKIEEQADLEKLITQLKPLMLSGMASFIIVSGQKLYYKYLNENTAEDSLIFNIFTGLIHVPLKSENSFEKVFNNLLKDKNDNNNRIVDLYVKSLILNSNRTMRNFLNLIRKNITWENNKALLVINESNEKIFETDSKLLDIISEIRNNIVIKFDYDKCITDYFTIQLHRWVKKIKQKSLYKFKEDEIFNQEDIDTSLFWLKSDLDYMFSKFIIKMKELSFIKEFYEGTTKYFKNSQNPDIQIQDRDKRKKTIDRKTIIDYNGLKKLLREIYSECIDQNVPSNITYIINDLVKYEIIDDAIKEKINSIINIVSKIEPFEKNRTDLPSNISDKLKNLKNNLIFNYTYNTINHNYTITDNTKDLFKNHTDIIFEAQVNDKKVLFFYKYFEKISITNFPLILDKIIVASKEYEKSILLISIEDISSQDIEQMILDCNTKGIVIILCYYNRKLKNKESIIQYIE